jgi:hypothetical protein
MTLKQQELGLTFHASAPSLYKARTIRKGFINKLVASRVSMNQLGQGGGGGEKTNRD